MAGISLNSMMGIISAQNNIQLAKQNQGIANSTYRQGRILERQGMTDGNPDAVEKGQEMQAKGKEMQADTFGHLGDAMNDLNNNVENRKEQNECEYAAKNNQEYPSDYRKQTDGELDVVIGDNSNRGAVKKVSVPRQGSIDIKV